MSKPSVTMVDTTELLFTMLEQISKDTNEVPHGPGSCPLYMDLEGINLCRNGSISIAQLYYPGSPSVFLVDFVTLPEGWTDLRASPEVRSFKDILESSNIVKWAFDPRNDADALYKHNIVPKSMLCLQVTDVAYRRSVRRLPVKFVVGLKKIMEQHLSLAGPLMETKEKGVALFAPERGGSYEVWNARPLDPLLVEYAASDVLYFPQLVAKLWGPLNPKARGWVLTESEKRCNVGSDPAYQPNGREKSIAPVFPF